MVSKGTEFDCEHCGKHATSTNNSQRFCSTKCQQAASRKRNQTLTQRKCTLCGTRYRGAKGRRFCSSACANVVQHTKWTDVEIIYLASINPGYGFRKFCSKLHPSSGTSDKFQMRILDALQQFKKDTGNDFYALIQDPSLMETLNFNQYVERYGIYHVPAHQGRKGSKARTGTGVSTAKVRTAKHLRFNWGRFTDDARALHDEEE